MTANQRKDIHNSDVPLVCRSCEARHKGICGALTPDQLVKLSQHTTKSAHSRDASLSYATQSQTHYSNILSGVVKLTKLMPDGRQQIVGLQFAPDFMGRPYSESADVDIDAATSVRLCTFPKWVLESLLKDSPQLEHRLHEQALDELNEAREWLLTIGRKTAIEKVASFLVLIATNIDPESESTDGPVSVDLPLKRSDIADYLGLTTETVSRQMTNLRKRGVIDITKRRTIMIPDLNRLKKIATQDLSS